MALRVKNALLKHLDYVIDCSTSRSVARSVVESTVTTAKHKQRQTEVICLKVTGIEQRILREGSNMTHKACSISEVAYPWP